MSQIRAYSKKGTNHINKQETVVEGQSVGKNKDNKKQILDSCRNSEGHYALHKLELFEKESKISVYISIQSREKKVRNKRLLKNDELVL